MKKIELCIQPSLDIIHLGLEKMVKLGKETRSNEVDFQIGGGLATYAIILNRFGVETIVNIKYIDNRLNNLALEMLRELGIGNINLIEVDYDPLYVTSVLSYPTDRAFVAYSHPQGEEFDDDLYLTSINNSDIIFANHRKIHLLENVDITGKYVIYDIGDDKLDSNIITNLRYVDYFFPNEMELKKIFEVGSVNDGLLALSEYVTVPIVTLGEKGCALLLNEKIYHIFYDGEVKFVDSTGAGDNFLAGFMYKIMESSDILEALKFATACGKISVEYSGSFGHEYLIGEVEMEALKVKITEEYDE